MPIIKIAENDTLIREVLVPVGVLDLFVKEIYKLSMGERGGRHCLTATKDCVIFHYTGWEPDIMDALFKLHKILSG